MAATAMKKILRETAIAYKNLSIRQNGLKSIRSNALWMFADNTAFNLQRNMPGSARYFSTTYWRLGPDNGKDSEDEDMSSNPFYDKYAEKIKKAKTEGTGKPASLEQISLRMKYEAEKTKKQMQNFHQKMDSKKATAPTGRSSLPTSLGDILKLDQLADKTGEEIGKIWTEYYKNKGVLSAVIPGKIYSRIYSRSQSCPAFIYPLVKDHGYEFILGQFIKNECFFTSLLNYQAHEENAPWQIKLTHFTELQDDKDIVLMHGEADENTLSILEAQCITQQLQMFYATSDEERFNMVHTFNKAPDKFSYMDVIREIEASRLIESFNANK